MTQFKGRRALSWLLPPYPRGSGRSAKQPVWTRAYEWNPLGNRKGFTLCQHGSFNPVWPDFACVMHTLLQPLSCATDQIRWSLSCTDEPRNPVVPSIQVPTGHYNRKICNGSTRPEPGTPDNGNFLIRETRTSQWTLKY